MDGLRSKLAGGAAWLTVARALTNLIAFVSTLVLARILTPADFGLVALATTMLAVISAVTEMSLASALIHHAAPTEEHFHTAWTLNVTRAVFVGMAFCAAALPVAQAYKDPRLASVMIVLGLLTMVNGAANPKLVVFQRRLQFRQDVALNVSSKLAGLIAALTVAFVYRSYWALVIGSVATQFVYISMSYWFMPYRPRPTWRHSRDLWSFSIWLTLSQAVNTLNWKSDQLLIGTFLGRIPLGIYTVGDNLASIATREATAPLTQTLFPAFTQLRDQPDRLRHAYQSAQSLVSAVALPAAVGCALLADLIVRLTIGDKWLPAVIVIQVLSCVFGLQTLSSVVQPLALATGKTKQMFRRDVLNLAIRLPTIAAGLYFGGLAGIVFARALTGSISIFINMLMVRMLISIPVRAQIFANRRALASVTVMAIVVWLLRDAIGTTGSTWRMLGTLVVLAAACVITYGTTTWLLWVSGGRGDGPERQAVRLSHQLVAKLRVRRAQ
ncbi:lipopolysaccharide biosynthesis protein [Sphingosinicellaceae bacterium]|nr:lipopolysaccharide biosynthesis protein [Sphingosinicellaceae bacterium]